MNIFSQIFSKTLKIQQRLTPITLRSSSASKGKGKDVKDVGKTDTDAQEPIPLAVAVAKPEELMQKQRLKETIKIRTTVDITPVTGVPSAIYKERRARIYKRFKNSMQSGTANLGGWHIEFDNKGRWENPLMGWCSSSDPLSSLTIDFNTKYEAIDYCKRNRWEWFIDEPPIQKKPKQRSYAQNYSFDKRTRVSTK